MLQHQQSQSQWGPAPTGPGGFAPPPQPHPQQPVGTTWNPQAPPPPSAPVQHQPGGLYGGGAFANAQYQQNQQYGNYTAQQQSCCPTQQPPGAAPHGYCCNPPMPNEPPMWPLHQMCDITTCAVFFFTILSIVGFGCVLGITEVDNLFSVYDLSGDTANSAQLNAKMFNDIPWRVEEYWTRFNASRTPMPTPAPPPPSPSVPPTTTPSTASPPTPTTRPPTTPAPSGSNVTTSAEELAARIERLARYLLQTPPAPTATDATSEQDIDYSAPVPVEPRPCNTTVSLPGVYGKMCMEELLTAEGFLINLTNWHKFRATLYFIAMLGSFLILALIIIVHRVQHPMPQFGQPGAPQQFPMPEPWQFFGTKLYEVFRVVWGAVSVVMFLWIVNEMYSYWKIVPFYKEHTKDDLKAFWRDYDRKFVATVVCGGIYVCWPLCEMALEIALWFAGLIPWFGYRTMCAQGIGQVRFPETPIEELPGCVRVDMFYVDCEQAGRLGFSTRMWEMITGTRAKYLDCLDQCGQPPSGYAGGAVPGGYGGGGYGGGGVAPPQPGTMGGPPTALRPTTMQEMLAQRGGGGSMQPPVSNASTPRHPSTAVAQPISVPAPPIPAAPMNPYGSGSGVFFPQGTASTPQKQQSGLFGSGGDATSLSLQPSQSAAQFSEASPSKKEKKEKKDKTEKKEKKEKKRRHSDAGGATEESDA